MRVVELRDYEQLYEMLRTLHKRVDKEYTGRNDITMFRRYQSRIERIYRTAFSDRGPADIQEMAGTTLDCWIGSRRR